MESVQEPNDSHASFRMSWTAYIRPIIIFLLLFNIGTFFFSSGYKKTGIVVSCLIVGFLVIRILYIRSVLLYTDDHGVWVCQGVFPWSRGTAGVKWMDIDDAVFFTGFWSWLFKSYTIRVGHRFTKSSEIVLPHIKRGHFAVEHINEIHRQIVAPMGLSRVDNPRV